MVANPGSNKGSKKEKEKSKEGRNTGKGAVEAVKEKRKRTKVKQRQKKGMTVMGAFGPNGPAHRCLGQTGTCTGHAQRPPSDNAASTLL